MSSTKNPLEFGLQLALCVIFIGFWLSGPADVFLGDPGLGWHLKSGLIMWETREAISTEPFLFLSSGSLWIHTQWLSDLLTAVIYKLGGLESVYTFFVGLAVLPLWLLINRANAERRHPLVAIVVLILVSATCSIQWLARPVLFSFLLFTLCYLFCLNLAKSRVKLSDLLFVGMLFLLWSNLHPGFVVGLLLLSLLAASQLFTEHERKEKGRNAVKMLGLLMVAGISTLLNPYGWNLHISIARLGSSNYFMQLHREWMSPEMGKEAFWPFYLYAAVAFAFLLVAPKKFGGIFEIISTLVFLGLSFYQRRFIPYFAFVAFLPCIRVCSSVCSLNQLSVKQLDCFENKFFTVRSTIKSSALLLPAIWGLSLWLTAISNPQHSWFRSQHPWQDLSGLNPTETGSRLKQIANSYTGRIFNSPDWGGYLIWKLWPEKQIYIDDRNLENGEGRYLEFEKTWLGLENWKEVLDRHKIEWVLLESDAPLISLLKKDPSWQMIVEEPNFVAGAPRPAVTLMQRIL